MPLIKTMVLILVGKSEIGAQVFSNLGYLICLRHWIRSRADTNLFFKEIPIILDNAQHVLSYHLIS